ncbi:MAG TPA: glycerol-3-phosphate 1-O-acyltransferase PlsY [Gemmatimonadales bacterium]|nr:glycerol-3-phosphate 1-O-acyltransferase PlsY [Gemmatimonadales bacterium]
MLELVGALVGSYLVGAIPTSFLAGKVVRGIDLREHGSKNLGATNVYRVLGAKVAVPVGLFDVFKGMVPVLWIAPAIGPAWASWPLICGIAAILGHVFSVFVGFKGGKGVATAGGVVLALAPWAILICLGIWAAVTFSTGYVSLGSITAALAYPGLVYWLTPGQRPFILIHLTIGLALVWFHRANIGRLRAGTENRFGKRGNTDQIRAQTGATAK